MLLRTPQRRLLLSLGAGALAAALFVSAGGSIAARADDWNPFMVRVDGKLSVSPSAPLSVISTDPELAQVLGQDLQVAGRLAGADATSALTITVTLGHRVLEPGMSLEDVAPGDPAALALLKKAGVKPPLAPDAQSGEAGQMAGPHGRTAAQGDATDGNDIESYRKQGHEMEPPPGSSGGPDMNPMPVAAAPVPLASAQDRAPFYQYAHSGAPPLPDRSRDQSQAARVYDTIFVARATVGSGAGALTVVAVAHPGYRPREIRQLIAENIANAVLH